jgi:PRTRC genetic system protein C
MLKVKTLERVFVYNGVKLPDPGSHLSVEEVRSIHVNTFPDLATATVEGPTPIDGTMQYTFIRAVGVKG